MRRVMTRVAGSYRGYVLFSWSLLGLYSLLFLSIFLLRVLSWVWYVVSTVLSRANAKRLGAQQLQNGRSGDAVHAQRYRAFYLLTQGKNLKEKRKTLCVKSTEWRSNLLSSTTPLVVIHNECVSRWPAVVLLRSIIYDDKLRPPFQLDPATDLSTTLSKGLSYPCMPGNVFFHSLILF